MKQPWVAVLIVAVFVLPYYAVAQEEAAETTSSEDDQGSSVSEATAALQENTEKIAAQESEIEELNKKIAELKNQKTTVDSEAQIIAQQLTAIEQRLNKAELELQQTRLSIGVVQEEQETTETEIETLQEKTDRLRAQLRGLIRLLYVKEQTSLITVWLDTGSLSDLFAERAALQELQDKSVAVVQELQEQQKELLARQLELEQQQQSLVSLQDVLSVQQVELDSQRDEEAEFLQAKKEEQLQYQQKIAEAEAARKEIEAGLFELKSAGVQVKLDDATDMARLAQQLTGVRAALIMAVLKVESNVGQSIGTGTFPDDMHPASREPFLRITAELGLDPNTAPISARPRSLVGWGGAMGPAQIMPQTWEGIAPRVKSLMGKQTANPYELSDAFVATAIFLADRGASSGANEREAIGRYLAGPNWSYHSWYIDRVLAVAAEYEKTL